MANPINDKVKNHVLTGIHSGDYTPYKLPEVLYSLTAEHLTAGVYAGFGKMIADVKFNTRDYKLLANMRENIYMFSAAKTYQQVKDMSAALLEGNRRVSFSQFKESADKIFDEYNTDWLKSEFETAGSMADNARKWMEIHDRKEAMPFVTYSAAEDEVMCEICGELDGITLPVDDPFWIENSAPAHFNCRCFLESVGDEAEVSSQEDAEGAATLADENGRDSLFKNNPGISGVVFKDEGEGKHPYFDVVPKDRAYAENNFNLPFPADESEVTKLK